MSWDVWVDYMRTDGDGLTHTSLRNVVGDVTPRIGEFVIVGNEDADSAVARVAAIDDGVLLVRVIPGSVDDNRVLLETGAASER